tara:strand:+ start:51 stop:1160 length:1110 start_codon:yes stop_codon:yes gene_type:complete
MNSSPKRKLAAIMFTDIVEFSRIMGENENRAITILENQETLLSPLIDKHNGNLIKKTGDGYLLEFDSSVEAVECAIAIQNAIKLFNKNKDNLEFHIRIGIHLGDIIVLGNDILGDGVNIASRIEPLANPDGICLTDAVYQSVKSKVDIDARRIKEVDLKHIDDKYTIYKVPNENLDNILDKGNATQNKKIKILNQEYDSSALSRWLKTMSNFLIICWFSGILGYISGRIVAGKPVTIFDFLNPIKALENMPTSFLIFLLIIFFISAIFSYMVMRRRTKIIFDDIRDVENMLGILIVSMGYSFVCQNGKELEYTHNSFESLNFTKWKLKIPWMRKIESLIMKIDGNTLTVEGINMSLSKLINTFKNYTQQ